MIEINLSDCLSTPPDATDGLLTTVVRTWLADQVHKNPSQYGVPNLRVPKTMDNALCGGLYTCEYEQYWWRARDRSGDLLETHWTPAIALNLFINHPDTTTKALLVDLRESGNRLSDDEVRIVEKIVANDRFSLLFCWYSLSDSNLSIETFSARHMGELIIRPIIPIQNYPTEQQVGALKRTINDVESGLQKDESASEREIIENCEDAGLSRRTIYGALTRLARRGEIYSDSDGIRSI